MCSREPNSVQVFTFNQHLIIMTNRPRPRLTKLFRKLRTLIAVAPHRQRFQAEAMESPRLREVQLELDLFVRRPQPWSFTD